MLPRSFKHSNRLLGAPKGYDPNDKDNPGEILALPVWTDGAVCVSCWQATWRERFSMLFFGRVWVHVWYGGSQPPIALTGTRVYLRDSEGVDVNGNPWPVRPWYRTKKSWAREQTAVSNRPLT